MTDTPYRKQEDRPVCADCKHRRDGNMMDKDDPWLDWFCMVTPGHKREDEYNPITGIIIPGQQYVKRCREVNKGECAKFERAEPPIKSTTRPDPPPQTEPDPFDDRPWWRRVFG